MQRVIYSSHHRIPVIFITYLYKNIILLSGTTFHSYNFEKSAKPAFICTPVWINSIGILGVYTRLLLLRRFPSQIKGHLCIYYNILYIYYIYTYCCITKRGTIIGMARWSLAKKAIGPFYIIYADQRLISVVCILLCHHRLQSLPLHHHYHHYRHHHSYIRV